MKTLRSQQLESTLDSISAGVFLLSRDGALLHANKAAERQIQRGTALRLVNNRLAPADKEAARLLSDALSDLGSEGYGRAGVRSSIPLPEPGSRTGLIASVLALDRGTRQNITRPFAAAAAVFVCDPRVEPVFPVNAGPIFLRRPE